MSTLAAVLQEKTAQSDWALLTASADFLAALGGEAQALLHWRQIVAKPLSKIALDESLAFIQQWQQLELACCNYLRPVNTAGLTCQLLLIDHQLSEKLFSQLLQQAAEFPEPIICLAATSPADQLRLQQLQQTAVISPEIRERLQFQPACHTASLMQAASRVFCSRSLLALEALLWQKPLHCGQDSPLVSCELSHGLFSQQIAAKVVLPVFIHHAILAGEQALHPERQQACSPIELLNWAGLQQRMRLSLPQQLYAYGFSRFWRKTLQRFSQGSAIRFVHQEAELPAQGTVLVWGRRALPVVQPGLRLIRLEDGFIRSVGLGAEFAQPMSWIFDQQGLYFDATQPSDLEQLLQTLTLTDQQRERAEALRQRICQQGVTKYNVGQTGWQRPDTNKPVLLVPGQVETDASIEFGAHQVRSNLQLLQQVRTNNPDAWVIYKPHPDVYSGARAKGAGEDEAIRFCDELVLDVSMAELLQQVDEVHLMTSLTGFEALLRGKKVVCYGWPFYAGWGLTEDRFAPPRRGRPLDIATLVYATLIAYPRYISDVTGGFSTPEQVLTELEQRRQQNPTLADKALLWVRKRVRWVLNLLFGKK
ncbi:capsular polysaccharide biosynthesis protein [Alkalimonas sp. MEB108]|uniref:Capsular polysaccharide biosynthesis protein n=1 Tax=Alkalimonas cellulosilytica TaxID=3058395 RepID=A0ABU7J4W3_9GAMM|nr:capsular polysaccharide biosynthesis protein [Alkalimonas sp. MEB108]MEE2001539.1 capsular polysaccharide biosynthesis protein [Alkalimonas sp. MEB108]